MLKLIIPILPENDHYFQIPQNSKTKIPSILSNVRRKLDPNDTYMISSTYSDSPNSYDKVINCHNKNYWINAIKDKLNNLYIQNNIYDFCFKKNSSRVKKKKIFLLNGFSLLKEIVIILFINIKLVLLPKKKRGY
jgi:hypothetical protein